MPRLRSTCTTPRSCTPRLMLVPTPPSSSRDLNAQAAATAQWEQAVVEQELKLWEKEEEGDLRLEFELEALASREATVAAEQKDLE
jgi:hypothetical protein